MADSRPSPAGPNSSTFIQPQREGSEEVDIYAQFAEGDGDGDGTGMGGDEEVGERDTRGDVKGRVSMYVRIVDEMIDTVLLKESYLFSPHELAVLHRFRNLAYNPKYLLTRLLLRKTNKIFSFTELEMRYSAEIGSGQLLSDAMEELIKPLVLDAVSFGGTVGIEQDDQKPPREEDLPGGMASGNFFTAEELERISRTPVQSPGEENPSSVVETPVTAMKSSAATMQSNLPALKDIDSGMTSDEERKDPELARVIKKSALEAMRAKDKARTKGVKAENKEEEGDSDIELVEPNSVAGPSRLPMGKEIATPASKPTLFLGKTLKSPLTSPSKLDPKSKVNSKPDLKGKGRASSTSYFDSINNNDDPEAFYKIKEGSTEDIVAFARGHAEMSVEEMIRFLTMAELGVIAKELKLWKSKYTRRDVINALLHSANNQTRLFFSPMFATPGSKSVSPRMGSPTPSKARQTTLPFGKASVAGGQTSSTPVKPARTISDPTGRSSTPNSKSVSMAGKSILYSKIVSQLGGRAIQVALPLRLLISRVNLVYYRTTITPSSGVAKSLMLPEILTSSSKRAYPSEIQAERTIVWPTRDSLLEYERALEMEAIVDEALGEQNHSSGAWIGPKGYGFGTSGGRLEGAKRVRKVWVGIWDRWKLAAEAAKGTGKESGSRHVLDRFRLGHILTRVVSKGAVALGVLHEYDLECEVLRSLLAQRVWRRGKRGAWYERLALVLMHHYGGDLEKKREAVEVCLDGLEDEDTHLIYRPRLEKRLTRLEKQLDLPADERHICEAELKKSEPRYLKARRVYVAKNKVGRKRGADEEDGEGTSAGGGGGGFGSGAKTFWQGRDGEVGVEQWVVEWWENKGYKGHHSESTILTTLFGLLFWPILYTHIPGAFETPYQLAPLDLGDDSFYQSRKEAIEERLEKMQKTKVALEMLREVDERERERGTLAIGVRWDFEREDLVEIVKSMGGKSLAVICRMFCEEYGQRASGVPDLIVWHPETFDCRFVEVKSPNDHLSETQKIWISVLLSAGIPVEVCHVQEDTSDRGSSNKKRKIGKAPSRRRDQGDWSGGSDQGEGDTEEEEDDEYKHESGDEGRSRKGEGRLMTRREAAVMDKENMVDDNDAVGKAGRDLKGMGSTKKEKKTQQKLSLVKRERQETSVGKSKSRAGSRALQPSVSWSELGGSAEKAIEL